MPDYTDGRDVFTFERREVTLPGQQEGDVLDYRGLLNRDGSVISTVTVADLQNDQQLYIDLGCKTVVGLPFKDISTSDSLLLRVPPALDDAKARQTLKRLADVAVHVIVPAAALAAAPIEGAVALVDLADAAAPLPEGAMRRVITVRGDEAEEELVALKSIEHAFLLLDPPPSLSRIHASRRVFTVFAKHGIDSPVIHHFHAPPSDSAELALQLGTQAGG